MPEADAVGTGRLCRPVRARLDELVDGSAPRWRRRLLRRHLRRCEACRAELDREREVVDELHVLGNLADAAGHPPPEGLLESLLDEAEHPGLVARAAVPARGAVSGARPALSVTFLLVALGLVVGGTYAAWRLTRIVREGLRSDGR